LRGSTSGHRVLTELAINECPFVVADLAPDIGPGNARKREVAPPIQKPTTPISLPRLGCVEKPVHDRAASRIEIATGVLCSILLAAGPPGVIEGITVPAARAPIKFPALATNNPYPASRTQVRNSGGVAEKYRIAPKSRYWPHPGRSNKVASASPQRKWSAYAYDYHLLIRGKFGEAREPGQLSITRRLVLIETKRFRFTAAVPQAVKSLLTAIAPLLRIFVIFQNVKNA